MIDDANANVVPTVADIEHAAGLLDPVFAHTPVLKNTSIDTVIGARMLLKVETLNPIRSFKGRGADTWMREVGVGADGVVCASVGNFGQGVAYAARKHGIDCRVYVGESANPDKVTAMHRLGAQVLVGGHDYETAIETARSFADVSGWRFVQDGRNRWIAAGAGTIARELTIAGHRPDVAVMPVGNSALILGIAAWLRHHRPGTRIVGVCAEDAPAPALSWHQQQVVTTKEVATVADGIGVREPFPESVAAMTDLVDHMVLVSEQALRHAVRLLTDTTGVLVEAAGAAGLAALLSNPGPYHDSHIFTPLCGANLPPDALQWAPTWRD
ncbi:threonine/serine dehydratase [Rhodococcus sp. NPDC058521]|uniref:threonine ammonia-lyase n=1 Tax=Rhodococcus sp. NPDC058521 TaxID=3346536 RepID=UPI00366A3C9D